MFNLLLLIVLTCSPKLQAQSPAIDPAQVIAALPALDVNSVKPNTHLDPITYYLPDPEGIFSPEEVFSKIHQFIPLTQRPLTIRTKTHWYAIRLANPTATLSERFITTGVSTALLSQGYWLRNVTTAGHSTPVITPIISDIIYGYPTLSLRLAIDKGDEGVLLVKYQSVAHFPMTLHVFTLDQLLESTQRLKLANGLYLGAIGILFLFFFGQFLISREKIYFYYSMFVFFAIVMMSQIGGPAHLFDQEDTSKATLTTFAGGGIYTFYFIFAAEFFQLRSRHLLLYRILIALSILVSCLTLANIVYPTASALSAVIALGLPFPILGAILAWRQNFSSALFFLVGSLTHCITSYFLILTCLGVPLFRIELIFRIACFGLIFDIICFALAIIYHSHQVRLNYNRQLQERINDLNALTESEQLSAKALSMSKQAVLNLAATAHDLQQPLSAMQLLLSAQNSSDPIAQNVKNALSYASALLNSAIGSAKNDFQAMQESIDAYCLLEAAVQRHQSSSSAKQLPISLRCQSVSIQCLPIVVNRILDNLLSNAFKYTQQGKILVTGRLRNDKTFLIQVWDTGKGMDKKQVSKLTTPFERLNESEELGFGLGLFIVKSLCHQAGYLFSIRSKENQGSCFSVWVPQATDESWVGYY